MRKLVLFLLAVSFLSCKKDARYGQFNLKNGQEVDLLVDHRYGSEKDILIKMPENINAGSYLSGFDQREPGTNYRIKARFRHLTDPPQDGPSEYFEFVKVINQEKYKGTESFDIQLIVSYVPGGPSIRLSKTGNDYYFIPDKLQFTAANSTVAAQLEEIWQHVKEIRADWKLGLQPKWKAIKATVTHDLQKFGKAYLVQQIQFTP
ncbi:hypothetical protein D3C87_833950 [compost metagenome]